MLFRNTSAPNNPFSSEPSIISSVYNKSYRKQPDRQTSAFNEYRGSTSKLKNYDNSYWENRQQTNITSIKQDNPFDRSTNLQDLVRGGLNQKHQYERSRKRSQSPFSSHVTPAHYKSQSGKYLTPYSNPYSGTYADQKTPSSSSYIPSYTSKPYEYNGYNDYGASNYTSSSYIPPLSTYVPLVQQPNSYIPISISEPPLEKKTSKFKPINALAESSHYSFDQDKRTSNAGSISEYFPVKNQQIFQSNQPNEARPPSLRKKDSVFSNYSQKQNQMKSSLQKKQSIRSNNLRFSSGDERQTFGVPSRMNNKMQTSDDPFDELKPNNANFAYESFVEEKTCWPQFIELKSQKLYYKALKPKPRIRST